MGKRHNALTDSQYELLLKELTSHYNEHRHKVVKLKESAAVTKARALVKAHDEAAMKHSQDRKEAFDKVHGAAKRKLEFAASAREAQGVVDDFLKVLP